MRFILQLTQLLALGGICSGATAFRSSTVSTSSKKSDVVRVTGNAKVPISEADILKMRHRPEVQTPTAEQQAAIEEQKKKFAAEAAMRGRSTSTPKHPYVILQNGDSEFQPLTDAQKEMLKRGRDAAIEDAKVHQVHTHESIIDHSDFTGKSYVFSWSDILNYDNGFYRSFYTCHGDRLILSTADYFNTVGINIFYYAQFQSFTDGQYYPPSYTYQYIPTQSGSGIYFEFVNDLQQCGSLTVTAYCGITSSWSSYCGGEMTVKRFYEYYGGYNPNIYKPEVTDRNDMCYDQSQYFCSSPTCLTPSVSTNNSWESYCATAFNGFGSICPKNATCAHGKYKCDAGFTDVFKLDHYIVDPNDCTACQMPRGCVPDTTIFPPSTSIVSTYSYNVSDSFANSLNYVNVSFGNICGKNISVYGCTDNQFGDQFIELTDRYGSRFFHNDDINTWRICSYVKPEWSINGMCQDAYMRLGCFGPGSCGGSVKVAIGVGCEPGTYSTTGFKPCVACPAGLNTSHSQSTGCHECATGYIGFNGTAPCVPCPDGYIAHNHMSCELCNANVLHTMTGDLYNTCLAKLLTKTETLEQRVDGMVAAFDQYLEDIKYGMPTVHPTAMPTRRRRSRAPTAGGM